MTQLSWLGHLERIGLHGHDKRTSLLNASQQHHSDRSVTYFIVPPPSIRQDVSELERVCMCVVACYALLSSSSAPLSVDWASVIKTGVEILAPSVKRDEGDEHLVESVSEAAINFLETAPEYEANARLMQHDDSDEESTWSCTVNVGERLWEYSPSPRSGRPYHTLKCIPLANSIGGGGETRASFRLRSLS